MNPKQLRDTIAAQCGFKQAEEYWRIRDAHTNAINKAKSMDEYDPLLAAYNNGNGDQQGEPTSFSAWLEANQDSIEPLDRTEATCQFFDDLDQKP